MEPISLSKQSEEFVTLTLSGSLTGEQVLKLKEATGKIAEELQRLFDQKGERIKVLLDMSSFDGTYDVPAIDVMKDFAKKNEQYIEKTAAFGGKEQATLAGEMVAALARRDNINFFQTKEEALAWLTKKE